MKRTKRTYLKTNCKWLKFVSTSGKRICLVTLENKEDEIIIMEDQRKLFVFHDIFYSLLGWRKWCKVGYYLWWMLYNSKHNLIVITALLLLCMVVLTFLSICFYGRGSIMDGKLWKESEALENSTCKEIRRFPFAPGVTSITNQNHTLIDQELKGR